MNTQPEPLPDDISVLDYLKQLFAGETGLKDVKDDDPQFDKQPSPASPRRQVPWIFFLGVALVLLGQALLDFGASPRPWIGVVLIVTGAVLLVVGSRQISTQREAPAESPVEQAAPRQPGVKPAWLAAAIILAAVAFMLFGSARVTAFSLLVWAASVGCVLAAFWSVYAVRGERTGIIQPVWDWLNQLRMDRAWLAAALTVGLVVLTFQFGMLKRVPNELISSQVDAFYTVRGIQSGENYLYFARNVVGEPLSYYWAALVTAILPGGLSFYGIKVAYAIAALVGVAYMGKLGGLLFNKYVGLLAGLLLGVAFWPVLQTRAIIGGGLVLPLMLPALFYLFKALKEEDWNAFLLSCVFAGLGIMTNKIFLFFPLVGLVVLLVRYFHLPRPRSTGRMAWGLFAALVVGGVVVIPLARYILLEGASYIAPLLSRISSVEVSLQGSWVGLFLKNLLGALGIANWSNRSSWVDGIADRPGVDWVTGAFFVIGMVLLVLHYRKHKTWQHLALVLLYPLLLIPSAISVAFPAENPSLARAVGGVIPVVLIAAFGMDALLARAANTVARPPTWVWALVVGVLCLPVLAQNHILVNKTYVETYTDSTWNASEMADVVTNFQAGYGRSDNIWVVGYPYWVDARAVAISTGRPDLQMAVSADDLEDTFTRLGAKLYILHPDDTAALDTLRAMYPGGVESAYHSSRMGRDFNLFLAGQ